LLDNGDESNIITETFDAYVFKNDACSVGDSSIKMSSLSPTIKLNYTLDNCTKVVNGRYFAFRTNLFDCEQESGSTDPKERLVLVNED